MLKNKAIEEKRKMPKETQPHKTLPLLLSEKILLAAKYYSPHQDPFVGLVEGRLHRFTSKEHLRKSYQKVISSRTTFHLLFEKKAEIFIKNFQTPAFKELKEFTNKAAFLLWKNKALDFNTGPLHEMAIYKTFFKSILCFKFHHLILDGFSLFIFFKELTEAYHKSLSENIKLAPIEDFSAYQQLMKDVFKQEREKKEIKIRFWNNHLKTYQSSASGKTHSTKNLKAKNTSSNEEENVPALSFVEDDVQQTGQVFFNQLKKEGSSSGFLKRKYLKKIYHFKFKENIGLFYLFLSLYSKALKKKLGIDSICLRIPFSARYHLKREDQKNLLASLSRSAPLFIHQPLSPLKTLALDLQRQARSARNHLIMDSSPWKSEKLKSFSKTKNQALNLSMSYLPYREQGFLGQIQNFYWQKSFLDLVLFVISSEKRILLSFSYNKDIFSKKEIHDLVKYFHKEIEKV